MNVRGEVLLNRRYPDSRSEPCSYADNAPMGPCGAVWKSGVLRNLPDRFTPVGIADDGTVGGNQLEGTVGAQTLSHPTVAPAGSTTAIRLATSQGRSGTGTVDGQGKYLVSMSAGGRALYWTGDNGTSSTDLGFCSPEGAHFYCRRFTWYASTAPAWGPGTAIRSDSLPGSGTTYDIRQDGDAQGIVGQMVPYLGNGYAMKDFNQGALATLNLAIDSHGTILYNIADGSDVYGLTPASSAVPAGWQAYALGRAGDVVVCSAPDANATRQMQLVNLYSGAATPVFSSASTFTSNGVVINVSLGDDLCGDFFASYKVANGRLLVRASSDADPTIIGAILTPRGVALP
jgi:hypothetical protein